jgi:hypothetical protein
MDESGPRKLAPRSGADNPPLDRSAASADTAARAPVASAKLFRENDRPGASADFRVGDDALLFSKSARGAALLRLGGPQGHC